MTSSVKQNFPYISKDHTAGLLILNISQTIKHSQKIVTNACSSYINLIPFKGTKEINTYNTINKLNLQLKKTQENSMYIFMNT